MNSANNTNNDNLKVIPEGAQVTGIYMGIPFTGVIQGIGNKIGDNAGNRYSYVFNAIEYRVSLDAGFRLPWDQQDKTTLLLLNKPNKHRESDCILLAMEATA